MKGPALSALALAAAGHHHALSPLHQQRIVLVTLAGSRYVFAPRSMTITPGTRVTWTNPQNVACAFVSTTGDWHVHKSLPAGGVLHFTFARAGTYRFDCRGLPRMSGTVMVKG